MGWLWQAAPLLAVLLCSAVHGELIITPSDINTCSNSTTDTSLQISRVQTCASASVVGYGTGTAFSFSVSKAKILRAAASACGDAVGNSIGELCAGADPMATIFNLATTCSTALAALYTKALTGNGVFDMSVKGMNGTITKQGKLEACGSSCSNSQGAAQAFAQAAACGVGKATDNCMAATSYIKTHAFTRAFVKSASESWGKACTHTVGLAVSGGETIAVSAAASIAQAITAVAASACGNCPTCKCKKLPTAFNWSNAGNFSNAAATVAGGRVGLAHAIADATTNFCNSDGKIESARSHARTIMASYADLLMGALGAVRGFGYVVGTDSWACGSSNIHADLQTVKDASAEVFADAAGTVFGSWCPKAAAKINQLKLLTNETLNHLVSKSAKHCTQQSGNGQAYDFAALLATGNKPFVQNIADALTEAKSCGCQNAACLWCASGKNIMRQPPGAVGPQMRLPAPSQSDTDSTTPPAATVHPKTIAGVDLGRKAAGPQLQAPAGVQQNTSAAAGLSAASVADAEPKLAPAQEPEAITAPVPAAAAVSPNGIQQAAGNDQRPKLVGPKLPVPPAAASPAAATASAHKQAAASKQARKMVGPQLPTPVAAVAADPLLVAAEEQEGTAAKPLVQTPAGTLHGSSAAPAAPAAPAAAAKPKQVPAQKSEAITTPAAVTFNGTQQAAGSDQRPKVVGPMLPAPAAAATGAATASAHKQAAAGKQARKMVGPQLPAPVAAAAAEPVMVAAEAQDATAAMPLVQTPADTLQSPSAAAGTPTASAAVTKPVSGQAQNSTTIAAQSAAPATAAAADGPQNTAARDQLLKVAGPNPQTPSAAAAPDKQAAGSSHTSKLIGPQLPTSVAAAAAAAEPQPAATEAQVGVAAGIQQAQSTGTGSGSSPGAKPDLIKTQELKTTASESPPATVATATHDPQTAASSDHLLTVTAATAPALAAATADSPKQSAASNQRSTLIRPQLPTPTPAPAAAAAGGGGSNMWPAVDTQMQKPIGPQRREPAASSPTPTAEVPTQTPALGDDMQIAAPAEPTPASSVQMGPQLPAPAQPQISALADVQKVATDGSTAPGGYQARPFVGPQRPPVEHKQQ